MKVTFTAITCVYCSCNNDFSGIPWGLFFCWSEHKIISLFSHCSVWTLCLPSSQVPPSLQIPQKLLFGSRVLVGACGLSWIPRACTGCQATPLGAASLLGATVSAILWHHCLPRLTFAQDTPEPRQQVLRCWTSGLGGERVLRCIMFLGKVGADSWLPFNVTGH